MIPELRIPEGRSYPNPDKADIEVAMDGSLHETMDDLSDRNLEDTIEWFTPARVDFL